MISVAVLTFPWIPWSIEGVNLKHLQRLTGLHVPNHSICPSVARPSLPASCRRSAASFQYFNKTVVLAWVTNQGTSLSVVRSNSAWLCLLNHKVQAAVGPNLHI